MNRTRTRSHSMDTLFALLLFGMFVLFMLLMLVFSAQAYKAAVRGLEENNNLHTAALYLTTKFRQHDSCHGVTLEDFQGNKALCLKDTIDGEEYVTYIYLHNEELRELFTAPGSAATADMGMPLASLAAFEVEKTPEGFYQVTMEDLEGARSRILLHPQGPSEEYSDAGSLSQP